MYYLESLLVGEIELLFCFHPYFRPLVSSTTHLVLSLLSFCLAQDVKDECAVLLMRTISNIPNVPVVDKLKQVRIHFLFPD